MYALILSLTVLGLNSYGQVTNAPDRPERPERPVRPRTGSADVFGRGLGFSTGFNEDRVSLNLSKQFEGETVSTKADFEVKEGQTAIGLNLSGACKSGEITISIIQPNGDTLQTQKITSAADIAWSARIPIKEGDEKKFIGKWNLQVKTDKAEGRYSLKISTR
jgi:hypothetical protein